MVDNQLGFFGRKPYSEKSRITLEAGRIKTQTGHHQSRRGYFDRQQGEKSDNDQGNNCSHPSVGPYPNGSCGEFAGKESL
jgi:hypothetical protein